MFSQWWLFVFEYSFDSQLDIRNPPFLRICDPLNTNCIRRTTHCDFSIYKNGVSVRKFQNGKGKKEQKQQPVPTWPVGDFVICIEIQLS